MLSKEILQSPDYTSENYPRYIQYFKGWFEQSLSLVKRLEDFTKILDKTEFLRIGSKIASYQKLREEIGIITDPHFPIKPKKNSLSGSISQVYFHFKVCRESSESQLKASLGKNCLNHRILSDKDFWDNHEKASSYWSIFLERKEVLDPVMLEVLELLESNVHRIECKNVLKLIEKERGHRKLEEQTEIQQSLDTSIERLRSKFLAEKITKIEELRRAYKQKEDEQIENFKSSLSSQIQEKKDRLKVLQENLKKSKDVRFPNPVDQFNQLLED